MNNCKIKNITENNKLISENEFQKQIELEIETSDKTEKIQFSGQGSVRVLVSV